MIGGTNDIKMAKSTEGKIPVMIPMRTEGMLLMNRKKGTMFVKLLIFEIQPTTATGMAQ